MSDYIKRETVMEKTVKRNSIWNKVTNASGQGLEEIINKIPPADVAPVRHGRWIECTSSPHWKCSMCGVKASIWFDEFDEICEWLSDYCPNCGAKMDEGEDNED